MTPEESAAHKRLEQAIEESRAASGVEGLLMDWIVVAAFHVASDEDEDWTTIDHVTSHNLPNYRILGLLDTAQTVYRREALGEEGA